jgi:hypothetical protein
LAPEHGGSKTLSWKDADGRMRLDLVMKEKYDGNGLSFPAKLFVGCKSIES